MTLIIRPIRPSDRPDWDRLWTGYLEFYKTSRPAEVYDATFARLTGADRNVNGFLAVAASGPVGLVHYIFHDHCWRPEGVTYLQDLYAAPDARGTGVGRRLIEAVYDAADAAGKPSVYWMTQEGNVDARKLYDRIAEKTEFIKYQRPAT